MSRFEASHVPATLCPVLSFPFGACWLLRHSATFAARRSLACLLCTLPPSPSSPWETEDMERVLGWNPHVAWQ